MTNYALFELDEVTAPWEPIVRNGVNILSMLQAQEPRCRDCGRKGGSGHCCGGADERGIWDLCDDCASLDGCLTRESSQTPGHHCSRWGITHSLAEHDRLLAAQAKRRAAYLRKVAAA